MSKARELVVMTAFGGSLDSAVIIAIQPDEWENSEGESYRTFVLQLKKERAELIETLPDLIINEAWRSDNGTTYCSSNHGQLIVYRKGSWGKKKICEQDAEFGAIFGFSGKTEKEDILFTNTETSLFVQNNGIWQEFVFPDEVEEVLFLHGLSPTELYCCADSGLYLWDGKEFSQLEGPDDELLCLYVVSSKKLLAVGDYVHLWSDEIGWKQLKSPTDSHSGLIAVLDDDVFIPTLDGILRLHAGQLEFVSSFCTNGIFHIGNGLIACGADGGLCIFEGKNWKRITLPFVRTGDTQK